MRAFSFPPQTSSTRSRGLGRRIHGSVEDTKLSTNKQHTPHDVQRFCSCSVVESGWYQDQGEDVCYNCPVNSGHTLTGQAITGCLCNTGYTGANPCAQCEWLENTRTLLDLPCAWTAVQTHTLQLWLIQWRLPVWHVWQSHSLSLDRQHRPAVFAIWGSRGPTAARALCVCLASTRALQAAKNAQDALLIPAPSQVATPSQTASAKPATRGRTEVIAWRARRG